MAAWRILAITAFACVAATAVHAGVSGLPVPAAPTSLRGAIDAKPADAQAEAVVTRLHAELTGALKKTKGQGFKARQQAFDPIIRRAFNLPAMAVISVGPNWEKMTEAQQDSFVDAFSRLSVALYAERFKDLTDEEFRHIGTQPGPRGTILVQTKLLIPGEDPVSLNYVTRELGDDGWQIVDVFLDGSISELAIRRSEYVSVIRTQGPDGLVQVLERKIADLSQTS